MIWWPALMDFCSWVPTQKNVLVWGGFCLSFSFVNGIQLPQLPPSPPFACCLMQPGGSAIEGPCLAVCQHGDLPFSLEQLINPISENCCLTKKKTQKQNFKINSAPGWKMCKAYLKFEVSPLFDACEPCCCKPMAYDNTTFRIPFMLLPYSTW